MVTRNCKPWMREDLFSVGFRYLLEAPPWAVKVDLLGTLWGGGDRPFEPLGKEWGSFNALTWLIKTEVILGVQAQIIYKISKHLICLFV